MNTSEQIALFRRYLRQIERAVARSLKDQTTCCDVTLAQCHVLLELEEMGSPNVVELAARLKLDASTLSRTVDGLVKSGLVSRVENPENRRSILLSLTKEGRKTCNRINQMCNQFYSGLFERIPAGRRTQLLNAIELLSRVFSEFKIDACCEVSPKNPCQKRGECCGEANE
jgi:DNA-binding MarR family transcriptional regulator